MTSEERGKIISQFYPMIKKFAYEMPSYVKQRVKMTNEDCVQELATVLDDLLNKYDASKSSLSTYVYICLRSARNKIAYTRYRQLREDCYEFSERGDNKDNEISREALILKELRDNGKLDFDIENYFYRDKWMKDVAREKGIKKGTYNARVIAKIKKLKIYIKENY